MMSIFKEGSWKGPNPWPSLLSASSIMVLSRWAMMAGWWNSMMEQPRWAHGASQNPPGPSRTTAARPGGKGGTKMAYLVITSDSWEEGRSALVRAFISQMSTNYDNYLNSRTWNSELRFKMVLLYLPGWSGSILAGEVSVVSKHRMKD